MNICVFASGNGSNMQAVIDAVENKEIDAKVVLVISNNSKAYALQRAKIHSIDNYHISSYIYKEKTDEKLLTLLKDYKIDLILLAGYMKKIPSKIINMYKVLNIHPALLPKHGGKGMYGSAVHESVLKAKDQISGCTVHLVDEIYDNGKILNQAFVPVYPNDTIDTLSARVLKEEHKLYVDTIKKILSKEIEL